MRKPSLKDDNGDGDEIDISRLKIGQEVRVKVMPLPQYQLKGKVSKIARWLWIREPGSALVDETGSFRG